MSTKPNLRIIQTIASTRLDHGGTSRSVPALCDALVDSGVDNHLVTATPADSEIRCGFPKDFSRVHLAKESQLWRQVGVGRAFCKLIEVLMLNQDTVIVHDHAVWLPTNHAVAAYCHRHDIPRIVSPRGMLGSWAMQHGKWKKRLAWYLYQNRDLKTAIGFHVTSEQEGEEVRRLGFNQPIAVVPNGVAIPSELPRRTRSGSRHQALFLSRIHPKKGLLMLIEAWNRAKLSDRWELLIAGPDENGHRSHVEAAIHQYGLHDAITVRDSFNDSDKWQAYVNADLFVLPSFNENFGIVIAEAMAVGLPTLTTTATPWQVLKDARAGWWVDPTVEALTEALDGIGLLEPYELERMGARARSLIDERFSWQRAAIDLNRFYSTFV